MIFLSHNYQDKDVVGPIAIQLSRRYGQENVFYDSWTIKPGDSIIGKMSEGLGKCKYFFFFISENSLQSSMVNLEWQSALYKSAKEGMRFIPIKIDESHQPAILMDKIYINMYEDGMDATITRIIDIIENKNSSIYNPVFHNIVCTISKRNSSEYTVTVFARKFIERDATILFSFNNQPEEMDISITSDSVQMTLGSSGKIAGDPCKGIFLQTRPITPKEPIVYHIKNTASNVIDRLRIWHEKEKGRVELLDIIN